MQINRYVFAGLLIGVSGLFNAWAEEEKPVASAETLQYLEHVYDAQHRAMAFVAKDPADAAIWRKLARPELARLLGLDRIAEQTGEHTPTVSLETPEDRGTYTIQAGTISPEPAVTIPFRLFRPRGDGPFPLGIFPHGHGEWPAYAGEAPDEAKRKKLLAGEKDVAVQAASRGILAIAPATRGLGAAGVPDFDGRFGNRDCRSQFVHAAMAGRSAVGERVWDVQRLLDWALARDDVDPSRVLVMGNSGGGVVTLYTAAVEERVTMAVCVGAFTELIRSDGRAHHCDCNTVPGIFTFGDFPDVATLIAPRPFLTVNGSEDKLFINADVDRASAQLSANYTASGAEGNYHHRYGPGGHRFYSDRTWPFVDAHIE
jgi:dienelactone hydrolase